ncbi:class A beta-lactamase-related serine hydrolase [Clostridium sp. SYSU_GA19001]|uniref:serine hydrolase n=1 Tax=Clostridium caldaquaticum TaxID=2940653 RepID=UPI0020770E62|nr:serine hydrolase [Clostridium caldaquaticum]MCM8711175.1 class A beta-lactamase-related serine hydrolase [Clostridium caldaquaticum]
MKELKRYLDERIGEYSFYFEDIDSSYTYSLNERAIMPAASCIKLPIAIALLKEVENNNISLQEKVLIKCKDKVYGSGILHEFDDKDYSIKELLIAMLIQSDSTATNKIIDILGMEKINIYFKEMGLKETFLKRKLRDFTAREKGLENLSSSFDLAQCLKILHYGSFLNREYSNFIINILDKFQRRDKLPFYMPERVWSKIANISGSLNGIENDAALLNLDKGNFVFVVLSKSLPNNVYGIVTLSKLGKMMWDIIDRNWK